MGTNINVNVELSNLLRRNKEDAAANRLAGEEKRSAARAGGVGQRARDVQRAADGKDPTTGNIQFGVKKIGNPFEEPGAYINALTAPIGGCEIWALGAIREGNDLILRVKTRDGTEHEQVVFTYKDYREDFGTEAPGNQEDLYNGYPYGSDGAYWAFAFTTTSLTPATNYYRTATWDYGRGVTQASTTPYLLPLSKDVFVLVAAVSVGYAYYERHIRLRQDVSLTLYETLPDGTPVYSRDAVESSSSTSYLTYDSAFEVKCYLVTKSSMREISSPPALKEILGKYATQYDYRAEYDRGVEFTLNTYAATQLVSSVSSGRSFTITTNQTLPTATNLDNSFRVWKYGSIASTSGTTRDATTPGIYTVLTGNPTDPRYAGSNATNLESLTYVKDEFFDDTPLPLFGIYNDIFKFTTNEKTGVVTPTSYMAYIVKPLVSASPTSGMATKNNRSGVVAAPSEGYQLYTVWDWGRSAYCRQQLLDLGFTNNDLDPSFNP